MQDLSCKDKGDILSRDISEKKNCIYCGGDTSTFCGYWKLISVENYDDKKKPNTIFVDNCYAHIGCYVDRFRQTLISGVVPLTTHTNAYKDNPKAIAELCRIHIKRPKQRIKANIRFLEKVIKELDKK